VRVVRHLRAKVTRLLGEPLEQMGRWARFLRFQIQLWRFCAQKLASNNAMAMSSALSFRTIFAMIPTLVLAFLLLRTLGVLEDGKTELRGFLEQSGLTQITYTRKPDQQPGGASTSQEAGEQGEQVSLADKIESLVTRVEGQLTLGRLGPVGTVLFIWTALTLLTTIERSLNRIFEARRARPLFRRIFLYWSVLTLGPLLLVAAMYAGRQASAAFEGNPLWAWLVGSAGWAGSAVMGIFLLAVLYNQLPNTHVPLRSAIAGAAVAVPIWLVARWAFSLYVTRVAARSLYGAMGLVPLFLMWLNLSWWIFLFGAQLAHTLANLAGMQRRQQAAGGAAGGWGLLAALLAVVRRHEAGRGPTSIEQVARILALPESQADGLVRQLVQAGLLAPVAGDDETFLPTRAAQAIQVGEVLRRAQPAAPGAAGAGDEQVYAAVARAQARTREALEGLTLADVLVSDDRPDPGDGS